IKFRSPCPGILFETIITSDRSGRDLPRLVLAPTAHARAAGEHCAEQPSSSRKRCPGRNFVLRPLQQLEEAGHVEWIVIGAATNALIAKIMNIDEQLHAICKCKNRRRPIIGHCPHGLAALGLQGCEDTARRGRAAWCRDGERESSAHGRNYWRATNS